MASNPSSWHRSVRLPAYDYTERGAYFVTICTHDRAFLFDDPWMKMVAERAWLSVTGRRTPAYDFVVMPNHVHGIIWLGPRCPNAQHESHGRHTDYQRHCRARDAPMTAGAARLRRNVAPGSLGAKVRAFKAAVTRRINARRGTPGAPVWQQDFDEHVVRSASTSSITQRSGRTTRRTHQTRSHLLEMRPARALQPRPRADATVGSRYNRMAGTG